MEPNFFIVLPDYGGVMKTKCALSLIRLVNLLRTANVKHELWIFEFANISGSRNYLAWVFFLSKAFTQLLLSTTT